MLHSRPLRASLRTLAISGLGLAIVALLAGCGSGDGDGRVTLPPGITAPGGSVTLPGDITVTRPPEEEPPADDPVEEPPAEDPIEEPPAEDPVEEPPAEDPVSDGGDEETGPAPDDATTDDDVVWWPWALGLLAIVAAVVAGAVARSRRRGSEWTARAMKAIDASDALTTHLLAIAPEGLVLVARDDAQRLTELDVTTQDLIRTAPDGPDGRARGSIDGLRGPLAQLHAAVNMVSLSPAPTPAQLALVHQWANVLHVATSTARSALTTPSS